MNSPESSKNSLSLFTDSRLLLYLFVGLRLMLLMVHSPVQGYTPGLTAFGDLPYFYNLATYADQDKLPYRDYWFEYPPVLALTTQTVYFLSSQRGGDYSTYALLMVLVLTIFDIANLILLRRLGARLYGVSTGAALAWIYALLAVPLVVTYWTFDAMVTCFVLLMLHWLLQRKQDRSALAMVVGALVKFFPLVALAAVWRFRSMSEAVRYTLIVGAITFFAFAGILAIGGSYSLPSLIVQFTKASSQTVWALIDGNYKTGILSPDHFDPSVVDKLQGNPPRIPTWLRTVIFAGIGLYIYATTRRRDDKGIIGFVTVSLLLLFLWSSNWSTQWQVLLIPLILLNFPTRDGVLIILVLGFMGFAEYPILFSRSAGEISGALLPLYALLVIARTAILIGIASAIYRRLRIPIGETTKP